MTPAPQPLDALLDHVKRHRGFDFTGYKRSSLERRIHKRMIAVGAESYSDYLDHLEVDPGEFADLFNAVLIKVTGFFRDPEAWDHLREDALPVLLAAREPSDPVRVWVAGCASGEEAYTIAMVLAEMLGEPAYQERVKIYATDIDEEALSVGRLAVYSAGQVEGVPAPLLEHYFERIDTRYAFRKDLRRAIIFGRNDLVQDAPISRIDLLLCRNTLMYFNAESQSRILGRLHFALRDDGMMLLGKSEMLITHSELFRAVDLKRRLFAKVQKSPPRDRVALAPLVNGAAAPAGSKGALRDGAFDRSPAAQVLVDDDGMVSMFNQRAADRFSLGPPDLGRPLHNLELSYRPVELRSHLDQAQRERRDVLLREMRHRPSEGEEHFLDVHIAPLYAEDTLLGTSITFTDVTASHGLRQELERSKAELENAYEELQSTVEELETTNEELQSTNEELETTNEELQSTNEELETMNEELQSTNEELEATNDELRQRTLELKDANGFLQPILTSLGVGVVVLDREQRVQIWNGLAQDLWGPRPEEVQGQHVLSLDIGLPLERLRDRIRAALAGHESPADEILDATNRRGQAIRCRVSVLPLGLTAAGEPSGAILVMESVEKREDATGEDLASGARRRAT